MSENTTSKTAKYGLIAARTFLGLIYLLSVSNFFFNFMPVPAYMDRAAAFINGLAGSGYFFLFLKIVEGIGGLALVSGKFESLAGAFIFPVTLNIFLFHLFLVPEGIAMSAVMLIANILILVKNRSSYRGLFVEKKSELAFGK